MSSNITCYSMTGGNDAELLSLNTDNPVRMGEVYYHYDTANQLVREDNMWLGKTFVWTYDDAGNITSCKEYAYIDNWEEVTGTPTKINTYTYGDSSWGDLLTAYNGIQWSYDQIGNLTNDGTWTYFWENGRELLFMRNNSTTWYYDYDANGMRTSRFNGTKTYTYVYNGSQLTQMTVGNDTLYFTYGAIGPTTVTWNGTTYYYALNAQGDVIGIFDGSGNCVVTYNWDNAWGYNPEPEGTMAATLGTLNPLRYRSYVYDTETGLYYLQSRYYNPEICRFINADVYTTTGQGLTGNNMFAYCCNNSVSYCDPTGTRVEIWPILFGEHDFGFIHKAVQDHIVWNGLIFQKELFLKGVGRADIYDPETQEIWEIKHGGSSLEMQNTRIQDAIGQVNRYIGGYTELPLRLGHAGAFTGSFVLNCGQISYSVSYDTPRPGVISYYVQKMKNYEPAASFAYIPKTSQNRLFFWRYDGIGFLERWNEQYRSSMPNILYELRSFLWRKHQNCLSTHNDMFERSLLIGCEKQGLSVTREKIFTGIGL